MISASQRALRRNWSYQATISGALSAVLIEYKPSILKTGAPLIEESIFEYNRKNLAIPQIECGVVGASTHRNLSVEGSNPSSLSMSGTSDIFSYYCYTLWPLLNVNHVFDRAVQLWSDVKRSWFPLINHKSTIKNILYAVHASYRVFDRKNRQVIQNQPPGWQKIYSWI
jgi:hypothetical protein